MSLQSLERQLNSITQKLEAIHADIKTKTIVSGPASPKTSNPAAAGGHVSFGNDDSGAPIGRRRNKEVAIQEGSGNETEVLTPAPPKSASSDAAVGRGARVAAASSSASPKRGTASFVLEGEVGRGGRSQESSLLEGSFNADRSPQGGNLEKGDKKRTAADRQAKKEFFGKLEFQGSWNTIPKAVGVSCVWLGCAALAIEFVGGKSTSMEDIMKTNHMALHYVSFPSVTLAELYDTIDEYLIASALRTEKGVKCEVATFDSITVDDIGDEIGMGERLPVMNLAAFRKELSRMDPQSILIFNYDPYVVQEAEIIRREADDDEDEESGSPRVKEPVQWGPKNQGQFALLLQFNPALHTVTIGTPHLGPDGAFHLELHTASVQTMYAACCIKDGYTNKSRGFVRVFTDKLGDTQVPSIFPLSLVDGRDAGGLISIALDVAIAPHILGLSMLHHVVQSTLLTDKARRRQSTKSVSDVQLRGIPVTKLCYVLGIPVSAIVGYSNKDSVSCAFAWYQVFLEKLGISNEIACGVVTVTRKGGAEDGAVNISDETFMRDIGIAVSTRSVMLIGFDVNVALNVVVENRPEPCHFGIVVGFDEAHGIVRLADVNVKKYRKMWHVPITRLYNATIGFGYIVVAKSKETIERIGCQKMVDAILQQGRFRLPSDPGFRRFEHPAKNYSITVLADAIDRLGYPDTNVESFVFNSGFHVSFLLSEHIPLAGVKRIASFYSHAKLYDEVAVTATYFDDPTTQTVDYFSALLSDAVQRQDAFLLVNFQPATIQKDKKVWNGGSGGPLAIVLRFDGSNVTLSDANAAAYYRTWSCPVQLLYEAVAQVDRISGRGRGTLLLEKKPQSIYDDTKGYDMRRSMVHHPFKPTISTTASAFSLAASEMLQKSYSQEQFIYNAKEFNLTRFTTRGSDAAAAAEDANCAFSALALPLQAIAIECATVEALGEALIGIEGVLSVLIVLYDTEKIHGVKGGSGGAAIANNRGEDGVVKLVDGNPTVFGDFWETPIHTLFDALTGVVLIRGSHEEEMES